MRQIDALQLRWVSVKSGRYPRPTRALSERIAAWRVEDIRKLLDR
jgi:hypothetical protein